MAKTFLNKRDLNEAQLKLILEIANGIEAKRQILVNKGGAEFEKVLKQAVGFLNLNRNISYGDWHIETWFDRSNGGNWITQVKHNHDRSLDKACDFTGHIESAAVAHVWAIIEAWNTK